MANRQTELVQNEAHSKELVFLQVAATIWKPIEKSYDWIHRNPCQHMSTEYSETIKYRVWKHLIWWSASWSRACQQVKPTTKHQGQRSTATLQLRPPTPFVLHCPRRHLHQELHHLHVAFGSGRVQRSSASAAHAAETCAIFWNTRDSLWVWAGLARVIQSHPKSSKVYISEYPVRTSQ